MDWTSCKHLTLRQVKSLKIGDLFLHMSSDPAWGALPHDICIVRVTEPISTGFHLAYGREVPIVRGSIMQILRTDRTLSLLDIVTAATPEMYALPAYKPRTYAFSSHDKAVEAMSSWWKSQNKSGCVPTVFHTSTDSELTLIQIDVNSRFDEDVIYAYWSRYFPAYFTLIRKLSSFHQLHQFLQRVGFFS